MPTAKEVGGHSQLYKGFPASPVLHVTPFQNGGGNWEMIFFFFHVFQPPEYWDYTPVPP